MTVPTTRGSYWAKWKIADDSIDKMYVWAPTTLWEVVSVEPCGEDDALGVYIPGVPGNQPLENFYWGPCERLTPPPSPPADIEPDGRAARARDAYRRMTPDQREEWLQEQRRKA